MKYLLLFFAIALFSCDNEHVSPLYGAWVEKINRTDTLIFLPEWNDNEDTYFEFRRPREMQQGSLVPGPGAGIYLYEIHGDKISLSNAVSACQCFNDYSFDLKSGEMIIENFYDPDARGELLSFERLE